MKLDDALGRHDQPDVDEASGDAEVDDGRLLPVDQVDDVALTRLLAHPRLGGVGVSKRKKNPSIQFLNNEPGNLD